MPPALLLACLGGGRYSYSLWRIASWRPQTHALVGILISADGWVFAVLYIISHDIWPLLSSTIVNIVSRTGRGVSGRIWRGCLRDIKQKVPANTHVVRQVRASTYYQARLSGATHRLLPSAGGNLLFAIYWYSFPSATYLNILTF